MKISSTSQTAAQVTYFARNNRTAATAMMLGSKTSAGQVSDLMALTKSLELMQKTDSVSGMLGRNLDIKA